ncbi:MAG: hypothetical protein ACFBSF_14525 [Leptolyngbyaceae cyanobacterium]
MTLKPAWKTVTITALTTTLLLGVNGLSLRGWSQSSADMDDADIFRNTNESVSPATHADATFLDWLNGIGVNPDANEPPLTKRGGSQFCLVAFDVREATPVWNSRPDFIIKGSTRQFAVYDGLGDEPLWTSDANDVAIENVAYMGPPLRTGTTYTLRAENPNNANDFEDRRFTLLSLEDRIAIATDLLTLESEMQEAGESQEAIALARADYFWQRGLAVDAWAEVFPLQETSETATAAMETAYERICSR